MSLMREGIVKIADLRPRKHARAKRLVSLRDALCFVADTAEAAWLTERGFEKLGGEIVTSDARSVWKILGHRLVRVPGLLLRREVTISTLDLYVFLLIVGKTTVSGSVLRLLGGDQPALSCASRCEPNPHPKSNEAAQDNQRLQIAN
jgi:hypothetical protein